MLKSSSTYKLINSHTQKLINSQTQNLINSRTHELKILNPIFLFYNIVLFLAPF